MLNQHLKPLDLSMKSKWMPKSEGESSEGSETGFSVEDLDPDERSRKKRRSHPLEDVKGAALRKREQNKLASRRFRAKKHKERIEAEGELRILEDANFQLIQTCKDLQQQISHLKDIMSKQRIQSLTNNNEEFLN